MYIMKKCPNCEQEVKDNAAVCPNCGEYLKKEEQFTDTNVKPTEELKNNADGKGDMEDLPEENYPEDELNKKEKDERSDFGR